MKTRKQELQALANDFGARMKEKLIDKYEQGYTGWDCINIVPGLESALQEHVKRALAGDYMQWIDVANLAAFLWWHGGNKARRDLGAD